MKRSSSRGTRPADRPPAPSRHGSRLSGLFVLGALLLGSSWLAGVSDGSEPAGRVVWLVDFEGPLGPANGDLIGRSIDAAADAGAQALIIRMDTPGGLDKTMRELIKKILASPIPIVTYVAPDGARAASAGTYITYASHIAAMAPATNIGSSTPVALGGEAPAVPTPHPAKPEGDGGDEPDAEAAPPPSMGSDAMARKVVNDAVAYLQGLAELRGRNIEWAEKTVREGANLRASEALAMGVVDYVSPSLEQLLVDMNGREVKVASGTVVLETAGVRVHVVTTDWKHDLLKIVTDPTIAYGLLIFGVYGLILEFYNPGMVFPSVIGIICILLGAYGLQMLPVNYAGLALIIVGIGMMVAELFTPSMGVLGFAGLAAFVFGSVILIDTQAPGYSLPLSVIAAFAVATGGIVVFGIGAAVRARTQPPHSGVEAMIGGSARALESFSGRGRVHAFGENWQARSEEPVEAGAMLEVVGVDGLTLVVRPVPADG